MLRGRAFKFGDNISTDHIVPGRLLHLRSNLPELAKHVLEDADPTFAQRVSGGDFVVAGKNFGLGSSREHAPLVIKMSGVSAVLVQSVARIFFRNAINIGLPILECPDAVQDIENGDQISVDLVAGLITNTRSGNIYQTSPFPNFIMEIIQAGGLVPFTRERLKSNA